MGCLRLHTNQTTDLRIVRDGKVLTLNKSKINACSNAQYYYYPHGPLARVELGDNQVQGLDYYYTLQGWLKGVNNPNGDHDAQSNNSNSHFALDEVQYQLGYYKGDYAPISGTMNDLLNNPTGWYDSHLKGLYNGNIAMMATNIRKFTNTSTNPNAMGNWQVNEYQYDQLNRIINTNGKGGASITTATTQSVSMAYTYDPNGNIKTLTRNGLLTPTSTTPTPMDNFTYNYNLNGGKLQDNKLYRVDDNATLSSNFSNDIDDQTGSGAISTAMIANHSGDINYEYDEIGNLTKDKAEGINDIQWNVYGKIASIDFTTKPDLEFQYDAMGNRVAKIVKTGVTANDYKYTFYFRDAQGNVLYTETRTPNTSIPSQVNWDINSEYSLYGSSRLGIYTETSTTVASPLVSTTYNRYIGRREFELSNHLGNVLATISDYKSAVNTGGVGLHYEAVVLTAQDYDPFGMAMPHRQFTGNQEYRFGFQNQEIDKEFWDGAVSFKYRIEDARLGRFFSTDPLENKYPFYSPYQFSGNRVLDMVELEGLEPARNPANPSNQDDRDPTLSINQIFKNCGGDKEFKDNFSNYLKGNYDANATIGGSYNIDGFTSDSRDGAEKYNHLVNNTGVFYVDEYTNYDTKGFTNFILGSLKYGVGPENLVFPTNGNISNYLKDAGITNDALNSFYTLNSNNTCETLLGCNDEYSGNIHNPVSLIFNGVYDPETMIGSASVKVYPINNKEIMVEIFNVSSLASGDYYKHLPWNDYPTSVVRDNTKTSSSGVNNYGNISQTYSFTLPIDVSRIK